MKDLDEQNTVIIKETEEDLKRKVDNYNQLQKKNNELELKYNTMQSKLDEHQKLFNNYSLLLNNKEKELQSRINDIEMLNNTLDDEVLKFNKLQNEYNDSLISNESQKSEYKKRIVELENNNIELKKQVKDLNDKNNEYHKIIIDLNDTAESLKSSNKVSDNDVSSVLDNYTELLKQKKKLEKILEGYDGKESYYRSLDEENKKYKKIVKNYEKDILKMQEENEECEKVINQLNSKLSEFGEESNKYKKEFYNEIVDMRKSYENQLDELLKEKEFYEKRYSVLEENMLELSNSVDNSMTISQSQPDSLIIPVNDCQSIISYFDQLCNYYNHDFIEPPLTVRKMKNLLKDITEITRSIMKH